VNKDEKSGNIELLHEKLKRSNCTLLTEYKGIKFQDLTALRNAMKNAKGEFKVVKNTMARLASRKTDSEVLGESFTGPIAAVMCFDEPATVVKELRNFMKTQPLLKFKAGVLGTRAFDQAGFERLSSLPPRNAIIGAIIGAITAPQRKFLYSIKYYPRKLAVALNEVVKARSQANQ
jgi:large subunit ribosomal protein L10